MVFDADSSILIIFCRRPRLGSGKQRIAAELGAAHALQISELLLAAALEDGLTWEGPVVIAPAALEDGPWAADLLPDAQVVPQLGNNLGERLQHVDAAIRQAGGRKLVFIGSDAPSLTAAALLTAARELDKSDAVLIPARDGGVTLMGCRRPWPKLATLPWETEQLYAALRSACVQQGYSVGTLAEGYDIDTVADLQHALPQLRTDPRASRQTLADWITTNGILSREPENGTAEPPRLSVIIPVYQDLAPLDSLLSQLSLDSLIDEIIVVDGGCEAECRRLCELRGARYLETQTSRGEQLAAGAAESTGDILWFIHADHEPPPAAAEQIIRHIQSGYDGGYFRFSFLGRERLVKRALAWCINLRARFGTPYGDQGLFMTRAAYAAAGGFPPVPLFEEVELVKRVRGGGKFRETDMAIGVSPRRWERDGWLQRTLHNRYLACAYLLGVPVERLARAYRPDRQFE